MADRYARLHESARVRRMVKHPGAYWPESVPLPTAAMLEPTKADVAEGEASGRGPGVSVFDSASFDRDAACWIRGDQVYTDRERWKSFEAGVKDLRGIQPFGDALDVVTDPLDARAVTSPAPMSDEIIQRTCDAHALLEGVAPAPAKLKGEPKEQRMQKIQHYNDALQLIRDRFVAA
jgi:hypothetical protein